MTADARDDLTIRPATRDEIADVLALHAQPDREALSLEQGQALFDRIQSYPDYDVMVAEAPGGEIVGTFLLLIMDKLGHLGAPAAVVTARTSAPRRRSSWASSTVRTAAMLPVTPSATFTPSSIPRAGSRRYINPRTTGDRRLETRLNESERGRRQQDDQALIEKRLSEVREENAAAVKRMGEQVAKLGHSLADRVQQAETRSSNAMQAAGERMAAVRE